MRFRTQYRAYACSIPLLLSIDFFAGRQKEVEKLEHIFWNSSVPGVKRVAVFGEKGIGKTQLAVEYSRVCKHRYDQVFFLSASDPNTAKSEYLRIIETSDPSVSVFDVQDFLQRQLSCIKQNWLIIIDSITEIGLNELLSMLPASSDGSQYASHGHLLFTTVSSHWATALTRSRNCVEAQNCLHLQAMDLNDAMDLFCFVSNYPSDFGCHSEWLLKIVSTVHRIPLFIVMMAKYRKYSGWDPEAFSSLLQRDSFKVCCSLDTYQEINQHS